MVSTDPGFFLFFGEGDFCFAYILVYHLGYSSCKHYFNYSFLKTSEQEVTGFSVHAQLCEKLPS